MITVQEQIEAFWTDTLDRARPAFVSKRDGPCDEPAPFRRWRVTYHNLGGAHVVSGFPPTELGVERPLPIGACCHHADWR